MKQRVPSSAASRRISVTGSRLTVPGSSLPVRPIPVGTSSAMTDGGAWRLPSGKPLAQFALEAGFLAPLLFAPNTRRPDHSAKKADQR